MRLFTMNIDDLSVQSGLVTIFPGVDLEAFNFVNDTRLEPRYGIPIGRSERTSTGKYYIEITDDEYELPNRLWYANMMISENGSLSGVAGEEPDEENDNKAIIYIPCPHPKNTARVHGAAELKRNQILFEGSLVEEKNGERQIGYSSFLLLRENEIMEVVFTQSSGDVIAVKFKYSESSINVVSYKTLVKNSTKSDINDVAFSKPNYTKPVLKSWDSVAGTPREDTRSTPAKMAYTDRSEGASDWAKISNLAVKK